MEYNNKFEKPLENVNNELQWINTTNWKYTEDDFKIINTYVLSLNLNNENPYIYIEIIKHYANKNNNIQNALCRIITENMLFKKNNKRMPLLELKYILLHSFKLSEWEFKVAFFAIKLGYDYPGIVGSAMNELSFKESTKSSIHKMNQCEKIVSSQNSTDIEGINTEYFISQTKGGLSLDFGFGCSMGCLYCYRIEDHREVYSALQKPSFSFDPDESIKRLLEHPWFTPHITPLGICMSTTEAFLPEVWPITIKLLQNLDKYRLTNRVTIITKGTLKEEQVLQLEQLEYIDLDICVCYSGLPTTIEPTSNIHRLDFLKRLVEGDRINAIGYLRPIIEGYNTSYQIIKNVMLLYKETGVRTITYGGLRFSEEHVQNFVEANIPLPNCVFEKNSKYMSEKTEDLIQKVFREVFGLNTNVALLRHSSCARVNARNEFLPDYNCHFYVKKKKCNSICNKHMYCMKPEKPDSKEVEALLERMNWKNTNYKYVGNRLVLNHSLSLFEHNFMRQNLLYPVFGNNDKYWLDE